MSADQSGVRVMLVDNEPERAAMVCEALTSEGYEVVGQRSSTRGLVAAVAQEEPDVVIIDMDSPDRDTLESMSALNEHAPRPVVFFASDDSDSHTIQQAVNAGVSAYIVDGLEQHRVKPIVDVAVARFEAFQSLRHQLEETRTALEDRKDIERAKGLVMKQKKCSEDEAFHSMRKLAMDRNQKLSEVARQLIEALDGGEGEGTPEAMDD
ncbi:hypothetical protein CK501_00665 [Halovibrio salipaludis]|uniref:Response regulator receiver and ANTAR domain protein n=1 Tax=Halovibrio salipaludis TaxID=2032626 RepID=A0A2A2FAI6_9GAMM|nr:ANTAR domain-containing protein [Halovibrio salipaludis]PAU81697.1 hypothetical protein CK501_00665 [Halovibrio salipaludis]